MVFGNRIAKQRAGSVMAPASKRKGRFQLKAALIIGNLIGHNERFIGKDAHGAPFRSCSSAGATGTAVGAARAATAAHGAKIDTAIQFETVNDEIDLDGFGSFQKFLVDQVLKTINVINFIVVAGLIQSQGQGRATSAAFVKKNADRRRFATFKVELNLLGRRRGYFNHYLLLAISETFTMGRLNMYTCKVLQT